MGALIETSPKRNEPMSDDDESFATGGFERKRPKISDLALPAPKRTAIDNLVFQFKKKGGFDSVRKGAYSKFEQGDGKANLLSSLEDIVEAEIDKNPSLLAKDRRHTAPLVEGAVERSSVYDDASAQVDAYVQELLGQAEKMLREIRAKEIGEEAAAREQALGAKTEEEWTNEANVRRTNRVRILRQATETQAAQEREEKRIAEEKRRQRQEEEEAREKERAEREERRRAEREEERRLERERERERQEQHEREREERRERRRREDEERERERLERFARGRDRRRSRSRTPTEPHMKSPRSPLAEPAVLDEQEIDRLALEELLKEGERVAQSRQRPVLDRAGSIEAPHRKAMVPKSILPRDPATARLTAKFEKTYSKSTSDSPNHSHAGTPSAETKDHRHDDEGEIFEKPIHKGRPRRDSSGTARTRSRSAGSRYGRDHRGHRDSRDHHRSRRDSRSKSRHRHDRSKSGTRRASYRERSRSNDRRRRKSRSRSPAAGIDRYIPGSSSTRTKQENHSHRGSDRDRHREKYRDRGDYRSSNNRYDRDNRGGRDRDRKDRSDRPRGSDIDRYMPGGGRSSRDEGDRDNNRDRDEKEKTSRRRDRSRSRSRG
ncbi:hypothetical protein K402DRAFT_454233 [Aulographum hederae CBS 113979]|uniref:BOD1/SHG1 domain-containing protein n=1 Tax=Aulographum hederae CBS 113979 TaxID=1176131 RepID=A0A6G1H0K7_9PEZI|nr:hypothetical protein K402DRAFT_454233 [Aulographum hederae CBS 113979]